MLFGNATPKIYPVHLASLKQTIFITYMKKVTPGNILKKRSSGKVQKIREDSSATQSIHQKLIFMTPESLQLVLNIVDYLL